MKTTWKSVPKDAIAHILSFVTSLPTYAYLCRSIYEDSKDNYRQLLTRMEKAYPSWYVPLKPDIPLQLRWKYGDDARDYWHIALYMNMASIENDWDALQVMTRVWNRNKDLTEWAIECAKIHGKQQLAHKMYTYTIQRGSGSYIDIYYKSLSWSKGQIRRYIRKEKDQNNFTLKYGWIAPKTWDITIEIYGGIERLHRYINRHRQCLYLYDGLAPWFIQLCHVYPQLTLQELCNMCSHDHAYALLSEAMPLTKDNIALLQKHQHDLYYHIQPPIVRVYFTKPQFANDNLLSQVVDAIRNKTPFPQLPICI